MDGREYCLLRKSARMIKISMIEIKARVRRCGCHAQMPPRSQMARISTKLPVVRTLVRRAFVCWARQARMSEHKPSRATKLPISRTHLRAEG